MRSDRTPLDSALERAVGPSFICFEAPTPAQYSETEMGVRVAPTLPPSSTSSFSGNSPHNLRCEKTLTYGELSSWTDNSSVRLCGSSPVQHTVFGFRHRIWRLCRVTPFLTSATSISMISRVMLPSVPWVKSRLPDDSQINWRMTQRTPGWGWSGEARRPAGALAGGVLWGRAFSPFYAPAITVTRQHQNGCMTEFQYAHHRLRRERHFR